MMDRRYVLHGKALKDTYAEVQADLRSAAMQVNENAFIYPTASDLQALVQLVYEQKPAERIVLDLKPAVSDEQKLQPLTDIIQNYRFALMNEEPAQGGVIVIRTRNNPLDSPDNRTQSI